MEEKTPRIDKNRPESDEVIRMIDGFDPVYAQVARDIEASVFIDSGYVESEEELAEEYEAYNDVTTFVVVDNGVEVFGATRIIANSEQGFKTINDAKKGKLDITHDGWKEIELMDTESAAEIGTIAVSKEYRGQHETRAAVKLYGAILAYCRKNKVTTLIASMDEHYYSSFKLIFGDAVRELGPMKDYMGSPTIPIIMDPYKMHENTSAISQDLYDQIEAASQSVV